MQIRTPFNSLHLGLQMLQDMPALPEEAAETVAQMASSSESALHVMNSVLTMAASE